MKKKMEKKRRNRVIKRRMKKVKKEEEEEQDENTGEQIATGETTQDCDRSISEGLRWWRSKLPSASIMFNSLYTASTNHQGQHI